MASATNLMNFRAMMGDRQPSQQTASGSKATVSGPKPVVSKTADIWYGMLEAERHGIKDSSQARMLASGDEEDAHMDSESRAASLSPPATLRLQGSQAELPPEGQIGSSIVKIF